MDSPPNLQFAQVQAALDATNEDYINLLEVRCEARAAAERITDVIAALRAGRLIDAHEGLLDIRADLRAILNVTP